MEYRKKILSHLLLALYLLTGLYQSVTHSHAKDFNHTHATEDTHQHDDFKDVHHKHNFHVGLFHFLGHLFENINHTDDHEDDHILIGPKNSTKKIVSSSNSVDFNFQNLLVFEVGAESLPDPPYHLQILQKLKLPSTPLRAPPSLV